MNPQQIHAFVELVLTWIGFGVVCGSIARVFMPGRDPAGAMVSFTIGLFGAMLSASVHALVYGHRLKEMLSLPGFGVAIAGAWVLLLAHRILYGQYFGQHSDHYSDRMDDADAGGVVNKVVGNKVGVPQPRYLRRRRRTNTGGRLDPS
jgi:uncharacterized membrane protein YeaQ/YmgE (transglycosylase-associated protein family)